MDAIVKAHFRYAASLLYCFVWPWKVQCVVCIFYFLKRSPEITHLNEKQNLFLFFSHFFFKKSWANERFHLKVFL